MTELNEKGTQVAKLLGQAVQIIDQRLNALEAEVFPDDGGGGAAETDLARLGEELEEVSDETLSSLYELIAEAYVILAERDKTILAEDTNLSPHLRARVRKLKGRLKARGGGSIKSREVEGEIE